MQKMRKLFVVSDIHGHYTLLRRALKKAGFDDENENHLLVCCGDLFDRGPEIRKVYDYIRRVKHKVLIQGNHDERLIEVINSRYVTERDRRNGMEVTLRTFFGPDSIDLTGNLTLPKYGKMAHQLRTLVASMLDYWETERFVFVHGWLPLEPDSLQPQIRENWRQADGVAWRFARFMEWQKLYGTTAMLPGKTIVCGHRPTAYACQFDPARPKEDAGIFRGDGMIAIDACTVRSGEVNVLVLEEMVDVTDFTK